MLFFINGWIKLITFQPEKNIKKNEMNDFSCPAVKVSIIIPAKDEQENICNCLNDIIKQDYPKELFEILVVDDCSEDSTIEKVEDLIRKRREGNIKLIKLKDEPGVTSYKKRAITKAIGQSKGKLIVTTDADCRMGNAWLSTIVSFYEAKSPKMIAAPVCLDGETSFFQKIQSLEFLGLTGACAAAISQKRPLMCNGANLAYEKSAFEYVGGFDSDSIATGDDMLLMKKIHRAFPEGISFLKSSKAVVYTKPESSLKGFIQQRKRWASKIGKINDPYVLSIAGIIFFFNILILMGVGILCFFPSAVFPEKYFDRFGFGLLIAVIFGIKCVIDFLLLFLTASFFKKRDLMLLFLPAQALNMLYVVFIGIIANFGKYRWKGRLVK